LLTIAGFAAFDFVVILILQGLGYLINYFVYCKHMVSY